MSPSRHALSLIAILFTLAACSPRNGTQSGIAPTQLTVFAAASLADAFEDLAREYEEARPGLDVILNFGASQALRTQIENGAQADVFASANLEEIEALADVGMVDGSEAPVFARNLLVVVLPADNPAGLEDLHDLARPGLRLIVADPAVPAGKYTRRVLDSLAGDIEWGVGFRGSVLANVVSEEESVRAVLAKVALGEADAGFVYASDAVSMPELMRLELPAEHNPLAEYPLTVLLASPHAASASDFISFVLSAEGQRILVTHGFLPTAD